MFDLLRCQRRDQVVTLCAFDLLELDGKDLRGQPIEERKGALARLLRSEHAGIAFNQQLRRRRRDHLRAGLRAWLRRYRIEAAGVALSRWAIRSLGQA
jgi:ATP-dependent DNA ligase